MSQNNKISLQIPFFQISLVWSLLLNSLTIWCQYSDIFSFAIEFSECKHSIVLNHMANLQVVTMVWGSMMDVFDIMRTDVRK